MERHFGLKGPAVMTGLGKLEAEIWCLGTSGEGGKSDSAEFECMTALGVTISSFAFWSTTSRSSRSPLITPGDLSARRYLEYFQQTEITLSWPAANNCNFSTSCLYLFCWITRSSRGVPVALFPWNKLACSLVSQKWKNCFLMFPVPQYRLCSPVPLKFGLCFPVPLKNKFTFPLVPQNPWEGLNNSQTVVYIFIMFHIWIHI